MLREYSPPWVLVFPRCAVASSERRKRGYLEFVRKPLRTGFSNSLEKRAIAGYLNSLFVTPFRYSGVFEFTFCYTARYSGVFEFTFCYKMSDQGTISGSPSVIWRITFEASKIQALALFLMST